jgi:hypothetical protein
MKPIKQHWGMIHLANIFRTGFRTNLSQKSIYLNKISATVRPGGFRNDTRR